MLTNISTLTPSNTVKLTSNIARNNSTFFNDFLNYLDEDFTFPISGIKYPPYNILKKNDDEYLIKIAVAGFNKDDLTVEVENNILTIYGQKTSENEHNSEYQTIYQGIAERSFKRQFRLQNYIEVSNVELKDGLLNISLVRIIPEELKPKKLEIK